MQCCAGSSGPDYDPTEEAEASEPSDVSRRGANRAWPLHSADAGAFSMAELRAKAEGLRATANQATDNLRASANKTSKQCVTSSALLHMLLTRRAAKRHGTPC